MSFGQAIDVFIGLAFVYLLLSLLCTALNEFTAWATSLRANTLRAGVQNLLHDKSFEGLAQEIYAHPLVKSLMQGVKLPSYVPKDTFAAALYETLKTKIAAEVQGMGPDVTLAQVQAVLRSGVAITNLQPDVRRSLTTLLDESVADVEKARDRIASWFDTSMDRVSGWYKRKTQWITLAFALLVAGLGNADSIMIGRELWTDPKTRQAIVDAATDYVKKAVPEPKKDEVTQANLGDALAKLAQQRQEILQTKYLGLPIGWSYEPIPKLDGAHAQWYIAKFFGLLITILALQLGAPFWFDTLSKAVNLRSSGPDSDEKK